MFLVSQSHFANGGGAAFNFCCKCTWLAGYIWGRLPPYHSFYMFCQKDIYSLQDLRYTLRKFRKIQLQFPPKRKIQLTWSEKYTLEEKYSLYNKRNMVTVYGAASHHTILSTSSFRKTRWLPSLKREIHGLSRGARNKKADKRIFTCVALQISHFQCTVSLYI